MGIKNEAFLRKELKGLASRFREWECEEGEAALDNDEPKKKAAHMARAEIYGYCVRELNRILRGETQLEAMTRLIKGSKRK